MFMGILYSFTCRPVNLSTRVDKSKAKYIGVQGIMGISYLSTCLAGLTGHFV